MTATAAEDKADWQIYDNQSDLISTTQRVLSDHDIASVTKRDLQGRLFVEASMILSEQDVDHIVPAILLAIGVEGDIAVDALHDILAIYDEFAVDDSGDDVYLGDGTWVTQDGSIRTK